MKSTERRTLTGRVASWVCAALTMMMMLSPVGCDGPGRMRQTPPEGAEVPILRQKSGQHCHETRAMQLVIRDAATLAQVPIEDVPVDFDHEMLLVVTLGRVVSDQYHIEIGRVWREGSKLRVSTRMARPGADAPPTFATPYCIAVIPKCDLNVDGFTATPPRRERTWNASEVPSKW